MLGTQAGWQLYWVLVGTVVLISAISVANLYVQGGMQLRHAAWFTLLLAAYDYYFSQIVPLTPELADRFQGYPLNAAVGFRFDVFNAAIGIGDLLAFGIFGAATYKAYGAKALRLTLAFILVFGAAAPSLTPLVLGAFTRGSLNIVVPVQTWFGPPAFLLYRWMRPHYGPERTMAEFRARARSAGRDHGGRDPGGGPPGGGPLRRPSRSEPTVPGFWARIVATAGNERARNGRWRNRGGRTPHVAGCFDGAVHDETTSPDTDVLDRFRLDGRVALVTGGSRGLGRAMVQARSPRSAPTW